MTRPVVTLLYVPADRPDRVAKALASGADAVAIDLEDAVAPARKAEARSALAAALAERPERAGTAAQVRVNAIGSPWHDDDLAAVAALPTDVEVRLPKTDDPSQIERIAGALPGRRIHPLLESPLGIERAFDIARTGVASLGLGEADLRSALGLPEGPEGDPGLTWLRSRVVNAAAAAGLPAPMMSAFTSVGDDDGLAASCAAGRALGFLGRSAIHPSQLPVIRAAFTPSEAQVSRAREIVDRVGSAAADGSGTVVLGDGSFLDAAMVESARRTLALAGQ